MLCDRFGGGKTQNRVGGRTVLSKKTGAVEVAGFIEVSEAQAKGGSRLTLRPVRIEIILDPFLPKRIRVSFRKAVKGVVPGDYVSFTAKLSPPPRASVPGGFDFSRYAYFRGIGAVGFATTAPVVSAAPVAQSGLSAVPICNFLVMPAAAAALIMMPFGGEGLALAVLGWVLEIMASIASWVAGFEGAVSRVPAMPTVSLGLMAVGGLWLCLLRQRWRLLGVAVVPLGVRPDLLIGDKGRLIVLRDDEGKFSGLTSRFSQYVLSLRLARDGVPREAAEVGM